jgi:hypothetical protein
MAKIELTTSQPANIVKGNPQWILAQASQISDLSLQAAGVREIINSYPKYATAHYVLGNLLSGQGKIAEAIEEHDKAYRLAEGLQARDYGLSRVNALRQHGESRRADQIMAELRSKY